MTILRILPACILTFATATALAHQGMHGPGAEFDADEDGGLSIEEYTEYLRSTQQDVADAAAKFAKLDRNNNGSLSSAEFIRGLPKKSE